METCDYRLHDMFSNQKNKLRLFTFFKIFCLALLLSKAPLEANVIQLMFNKLSMYKDINITYRCARRRLGMEEVTNVPNYSSKIKTIRFTDAGIARLSAFPEEAIKYAVDSLTYATNVKSPFKWIVSRAIDYCKNNNMMPDWDLQHHMMLVCESSYEDAVIEQITYHRPVAEKLTYSKDTQENSKNYNKKTHKTELSGRLPDFVSPTYIPVDKNQQRIDSEKALLHPSVKALQERWGITIVPPRPDFITEENRKRSELLKEKHEIEAQNYLEQKKRE